MEPQPLRKRKAVLVGIGTMGSRNPNPGEFMMCATSGGC
jgi:hypothetical protein